VTYILPDDWYANHGMAPGTARSPQPILQPRPGNLAPTPPIRGYFGTPPPRPQPDPRLITQSPWAVSDQMYGLGSDLGSDPNKVMSQLQKDMKELMIRQAALVTGITLALNVIPVAGQAAALVFTVVQGLVGSRYAGKAQEVVADTQIQAQRIGAEYEVKLQAAQNRIFEEEVDGARALALSCSNEVAEAHGIDGFSLKKAVKSVLNPVTHIKAVTQPVGKVVKKVAPSSVDKIIDKVDKKLDTAEQKYENVIDTISGERVLIKAREARTKVLGQVRDAMEERYQELVADMDTPEYRANLRQVIAATLLENAAVAQLAKDRCALTGGRPATGLGPGVLATSANAGRGWTAAAAAGAALLLVMGMGK
jgi:hypothetical protein